MRYGVSTFAKGAADAEPQGRLIGRLLLMMASSDFSRRARFGGPVVFRVRFL